MQMAVAGTGSLCRPWFRGGNRSDSRAYPFFPQNWTLAPSKSSRARLSFPSASSSKRSKRRAHSGKRMKLYACCGSWRTKAIARGPSARSAGSSSVGGDRVPRHARGARDPPPISWRIEAAEILRSLIHEIRLTPESGELQVELVGDLAGILAFVANSSRPAMPTGVEITLVAGEGFEPPTLGL